MTMAAPLPPVQVPMSNPELRQLWETCAPDSTERRLLEEISRLHRILVLARQGVDRIRHGYNYDPDACEQAMDRLQALLDGQGAVIAARAKGRLPPV